MTMIYNDLVEIDNPDKKGEKITLRAGEVDAWMAGRDVSVSKGKAEKPTEEVK